MPKRKNRTATDVSRKTEQKVATFAEFQSFIRDNICSCEYCEGTHFNLSFPAFELMPRDYLEYANEALTNATDANRINCVAHLKRAAECQADTFLHLMSLKGHAQARNFPSKMNTIGCLDLLPSRSIAELNRVRNKMEHEYAIPQIVDLTLYFDLVAGFVSAVEGAIFMFASSSLMHFRNELDETNVIAIDVEYRTEEPEFICKMSDGAGRAVFTARPDDWKVWTESLRIYFLLCRYDRILSHEHFLKHLDRPFVT